jgi:Flp pilus assembly protein TadD
MASLATLFVLLSMAMYLAGRTRALRGPKALWYAISALFLALGLGTKETAAIVALVLLTYEWCFHRAEWRSRFRQIWSGSALKRLVLVVLAVSIAGLATAGLLAWVGGNPFRLSESWPGRDFNGIERVLTQTRAHWLYLSLLVWPAPGRLNLDHDFAVSRGLLQPPSTLFASIGLVLLVGIALYLSFKRPRVGFPLLAYFEFHALESGPVNLELVFEHRMYLPMAMLAVAVAAILDRIRRPARAFALAGGVVCLVLLAGATRVRNETWSDPVALAYDIAQKSPSKPRVHMNLGGAYRRAGLYEEAETAFRRALDLDPYGWNAHFGLGSLYLAMGRPEAALAEFQEVLRLRPMNMRAAYSIGQSLEDLGRRDEAFRYYMNLGRRLGMGGRAFEAIEPLRRAVAIDSMSSSAHNALANVYLLAGMRQNAAREYRTALEFDSDNVQAIYNLASVLEQAGEISEAVQLYRRFVEMAPPELGRQVEAVRQRFPAIGAANQQ